MYSGEEYYAIYTLDTKTQVVLARMYSDLMKNAERRFGQLSTSRVMYVHFAPTVVDGVMGTVYAARIYGNAVSIFVLYTESGVQVLYETDEDERKKNLIIAELTAGRALESHPFFLTDKDGWESLMGDDDEGYSLYD